MRREGNAMPGPAQRYSKRSRLKRRADKLFPFLFPGREVDYSEERVPLLAQLRGRQLRRRKFGHETMVPRIEPAVGVEGVSQDEAQARHPLRIHRRLRYTASSITTYKNRDTVGSICPRCHALRLHKRQNDVCFPKKKKKPKSLTDFSH